MIGAGHSALPGCRGGDLIWLPVIIVLAFGIQIPPQLILNHRPGQRPESGPIPQPKRKTQ
jgi:hypothetical protein